MSSFICDDAKPCTCKCPNCRKAWMSAKSGRLTFRYDVNKVVPNFYLWIPCGKCFTCRKSKAFQWSVRAMHEIAYSSICSWATFTYDDEHLIHSDIDDNGELCYSDVQKMIKRMRKAGLKFRYLCGSEYGSKTRRPHYHIVFFGLRITEEIIRKFWPCDRLRNHHISVIAKGDMSVGRYVASYTCKKLLHEEFSHRNSERITCSQGIGRQYADNHPEMFLLGFIRLGMNRTSAIPKYYLRRLARSDIELYYKICDENLERAKNQDPPDFKKLRAANDNAIARARLMSKAS